MRGIFHPGICTMKMGIAEIWTAAEASLYACAQDGVSYDHATIFAAGR
jgi:hypothetical protein